MKDKSINRPPSILPLIIVSQFAGTSLWFAGNAVINDLKTEFNLAPGAVGDLTSAVQFGFIAGTLVFAFLSIADRCSPSKVFFVAAILGAISNLSLYFFATDQVTLLLFRGLTGFFLAGIYPVGMKISADWYEKGLGRALGFLVGALVLGTAFPHFLKAFTQNLPWETLIYATSGLAALGGFLILTWVPDGPYRKSALHFELSGFFKIFKRKSFRAAAFGYFGHMWELYSFWAFIPLILTYYLQLNPEVSIDISLWSFIIIAVGALGCIFGGEMAMKMGSAKVSFYALLISGMCCLLSPLAFLLNINLFIIFLLIWGIAVVADSPQFSTLVARTAPVELKGTALTIVNSIGFAITILSLQWLKMIDISINHQYLYLLLLPGPIFGMLAVFKLVRKDNGRES